MIFLLVLYELSKSRKLSHSFLMTSNICNKTMVSGQESHFALLTGEMYCMCQQGASGCYIHPHVLDWKMQQSKKMLNNAENWIGILVLRVYPCACVVKCMDVHGGRHSTENQADVELNFLLGSHHSRDIKPINHRKSRTEIHNKVTIMKRWAKKLMITLIFHHGLAQRHSFSHLRFSILCLYRCNHQLTYNTLLSTY